MKKNHSFISGFLVFVIMVSVFSPLATAQAAVGTNWEDIPDRVYEIKAKDFVGGYVYEDNSQPRYNQYQYWISKDVLWEVYQSHVQNKKAYWDLKFHLGNHRAEFKIDARGIKNKNDILGSVYFNYRHDNKIINDLGKSFDISIKYKDGSPVPLNGGLYFYYNLPLTVTKPKEIKPYFIAENETIDHEKTKNSIKSINYFKDTKCYANFGANSSDGYKFIFNYEPGWHKDSKGWLYINDDGSYPTNKWEKIKSKWYYFNKDSYMETGWTKVGSKWYYMDSSGAMETGWVKSSGKWYYMDSSGAMETGWTKVGSKWYHMNSSGAMETGWVKSGGKWYHMNSSGAMETGWIKVGGKWYYMDSSGAMQTGWTRVGSKWYYMNSSGVMQTGWLKSGGKWYYLDKSGAMLTNTTVGGYKLGKDGVML